MDNLTRELGVKQEAQPFGRGNIRVGELDEEIRGGIEIQQEKPMVYCAMAMNMDLMYDNLQLRDQILNEEYLERGEKELLVTKLENQSDIQFNLLYIEKGDIVDMTVVVLKNKEKIDSHTFSIGNFSLQEIELKITEILIPYVK